MKGLKIFLVLSFMLLAFGMQASAPPGENEFNLSIDELQPSFDAIPVVSLDIISVENIDLVRDYTYLQEGWVDDYSVKYNRFEYSFIEADIVFNRFIASVELELWLITNKDSQFLNTDYKPPIASVREYWIDYDMNLYSYSRPYYNPGTSFFMIC